MLFIWLIKLTVLNFYVIRNWIVYEGINNKKNVLSTKSAY